MLLSNNQIINNLKRTASVGLISLLNQKQLEELALKYFSKYEDGKLVYICPYRGLPIKDSKDIVLEHIIPVSSNGGTVLFNCIPTSKKVNGLDEKGARHLLSWWKQKEYYSPDKLDKLLSYMFEAYDTVFKEHTIEEVENSYNDIDLEEETITQEADLTTTRKEQAKRLKEQAEYTGVISYLGFINDCMSELKNNGYDITKYQEKLKQYEQDNIFKEIDRYTLIQETLRKVIKTKIEEDNRSELTYMLNINVSKLMQSIKNIDTEEQIYNEILTRINNIENILEQNNIGIISFFEDAKNHDILCKNISEINEEDINKVTNEINLCVADKFNKMCEFVIKKAGKLPRTGGILEKQEKTLGEFRKNIKSLTKNGKFYVQLTKEQLKYLRESKYESLREIYKVILNKAVQNNVEIEYVDEEMKIKIEEFHRKNKGLSIEEQIELEQDYKDVIVTKSQFNEFINYVIKNNGKLPSQISKEEQEKKLGGFKGSIKNIKKNGKFNVQLTKEQLKYLYDSKYESLREVYKVILNKAIQNNIEIEYVDEDMKTRIEEFHKKNQGLSIEEQIELEQVYKDVVIIESQFNEFINYVIKNAGKLPSQISKEEREKVLGDYRSSIQRLKKNGKFNVRLTKEQLKYLYDSKYESLREVYKVILNKAIQNNIEIEYVDEEMKIKIEEFHRKNKGLSIEEQIELEQDYKDVIVIKSLFNEFINYVIKNNGKLPSENSKEEQEKKLGGFRNSIQTLTKNGKFSVQLTKDQLKYLYDSKYESLREIYKVILNKATQNNIEIEHVDEEMKKRIEEFHRKNKGLSIEEQIELEKEYKDVIIIESQFNEFIYFVKNNNGKLPSDSAKEEQERALGKFRNSIQRLTKKGKFNVRLTKEQLKYLYDSKYESLQEIYKVILNKAIQNNIEIEYVDEEMKKRIEEFHRKNKGLSIEEQIELEQDYKDVIVIKSLFNEFINYVIKNAGKLPSQISKEEREKKLGNFRSNVQLLTKKGKFSVQLTKEQLEYLYNSNYESLVELYNNIMEKAYSVNNKEYIDIDNEIRYENRKGRVA